MSTALFENYYNVSKTVHHDIDTLRIPLGISEAGIPEYIDITEEPRHHLVVAGHAGTGKSVYMHTLIGSLLLNYTAQQVHIWLSDGGACEFNRFASNTPAHIKRVHTSRESDASVAFAEALEEEVNQRLTCLAAAKKNSYYSCCHETGQPPFPRLVVIIDGFDHFARGLSNEGLCRLNAVIHRAAACGITLVISTQEALYLAQQMPSGFFNSFGIRIATAQLSDSHALLFEPISVNPARNLVLGEAFVNMPTTHKINLLFLSMKTEEQIIKIVS